MRAEEILLKNTKSATACLNAIDAIESDRRNYSCTDEEWNGGAIICPLKVKAQLKVNALTRKLYRFSDMGELL